MEKTRLFGKLRSVACATMLAVPLLCPTPVLSEEIEAATLDRKGGGFDHLTELSLSDLMNIQITSASKKPEKVLDTAAAVFVITEDDIRRSGALSIAELLRMVPGIHVARIDANKWAVSSRGFNGRFSNKLLVLMDGRTVYTPLFSGVFWETQDTLLEDIDRIEVIRGPGASVWGANAVNGVINIITKHAADTEGGYVTAGFGTEEEVFAGARYGHVNPEEGAFRLYAKGFSRDSGALADGTAANDRWHSWRSGARYDRDAGDRNAWTLQGDLYSGHASQSFRQPLVTPPYSAILADETTFWGGHLLGRWTRRPEDGSELVLQSYIDLTRREDRATADEERETFDIDFQHRIPVGKKHELIWGAGYRLTTDEIASGTNTNIDPKSRTDSLYSAFVQGDIGIAPHRLRLTLGSKFEHNDYSGFEVQPTGRLLFTPNPRNAIWLAASRAVRTPTRGEADATIALQTVPPMTGNNPGPFPLLTQIESDGNFDTEELVALEGGYRFVSPRAFSVDLALFWNLYQDLRSSHPGAPAPVPSPTPSVVQPLVINNAMDAFTYGAEIAAAWDPFAWCRMKLTYAYLAIDARADTAGRENVRLLEDSAPAHQVSMRMLTEPTTDTTIDLWLRYVSELPALNVDEYVTLDLRFGWKPAPHIEISLVGQNLLDDQHAEFVPEFGFGSIPSEVERSFYAKFTWQH